MTTKLQDPKTAAKTYWAILSRLLYKKKMQQYHLYLLTVNLSLIFVKKQIFLITFLRQYVHQKKKSSLLPLFSYRTNARITSFDITDEDILIIKNLDPAKAHSCDNISIKIFKFVVSL